jgi:CheY-like chemotaxis protein
MATGIGEAINAVTAPLFQADAYLDKPYTPAQVLEKIQQVVAKLEAGIEGG